MTPLQIVFELEEALHKTDSWLNACYAIDIDYSFLFVVREAFMSQITEIKRTLAYKMEQYEAYGEPLDEIGIEDIRALIEEIGYDQALLLFGESVTTVLNEAIAEEVYRV